METSLSWTGVSAGARSAREACSSARIFRHLFKRCSSRVSKWGEYVSFPRCNVSCILSKVWLAESRSLAEKKAASLR